MAGNQNRIDLTVGSPLTGLLRFSLPLVAGTLFQQLYSFADTVMVGRLVGEGALAAVGATYPLNFLILGFVQGLCVGFAIPLAQACGAKAPDDYRRFYWNGCWLCAAVGLCLTAATALTASPLLRLLNTPADVFADAAVYIRVIFWGIPAALLYNFCSGALRAAGDSRHPLYFLLFSSLLNIALDYLLLAAAGMGVRGAALATVLSQLVSGLLCLYWLAARTDLLQHSAGLRGPQAACLRRLWRLGFPMGLEYSISALGALAMQGALNLLGSTAVAGQTAGEKIRQLFTLPMESVGMGMATYAGQNEGAARPDRIRAGIRAGLLLQWSYCAAAWLVLFAGKTAFTALVLGQDGGAAAAYAVEYLTRISPWFFLHGALMIFRNTLQGMGYSVQAVLSGAGELLGRGLGSLLTLYGLGFAGICYANPLAWGLAMLYCAGMTALYLGRRLRAAAPSDRPE